jgi:peptide/nickel transport system substrate-binding protein
VLEKLPDEWSINPLGFITQHITPGAVALGSGDFGPDGLPPDAFADVHLRRMLGLCFDHRRYVDDVLDGEGLLHLPPFPAPALAGGAVSLPVFDLERARDELRLAWDGRVARSGCQIVIYTHAANISRVRAAEYLAEGLSAVNPRIVPVIEAIDFPTLTTMLYAGRCPVAWAGWASDFLHPHAFASALLDPRAPLPAALGMDDRQLTDLLHSARAAVDGTAGWSAYRRLAAYATDRALFLAPPGKMSYMTYADRWTGVRLKHHVPNVLDFDSFRLRLVGQGSP